MAGPITAVYMPEKDDWTITVAGLGKELTGHAPGIIAARDRADQLVEKLSGDGEQPTVVHLLNGSALEFTTAYMTARLARPAVDEKVTESDNQPETESPAGKASAETTGAKSQPQATGSDTGSDAAPGKEESGKESLAGKLGSGKRIEQAPTPVS